MILYPAPPTVHRTARQLKWGTSSASDSLCEKLSSQVSWLMCSTSEPQWHVWYVCRAAWVGRKGAVSLLFLTWVCSRPSPTVLRDEEQCLLFHFYDLFIYPFSCCFFFTFPFISLKLGSFSKSQFPPENNCGHLTKTGKHPVGKKHAWALSPERLSNDRTFNIDACTQTLL